MSRYECCGSNEEHYTGCPMIEIEENCVANHHAVRYSFIESRPYNAICSKCLLKIERLDKK